MILSKFITGFTRREHFGVAAPVVESPSAQMKKGTASWFSRLKLAVKPVTEVLGSRLFILIGWLVAHCPWMRRPDTGHRVPETKPADVSVPVETSTPSVPTVIWDRSLADRKLWLLRRSGLFGSDSKGATFTRALTLEDFRKAYRLVHDVYLGTEFIKPEPAGLRLRIFETTPDMATFVAKANGRVVGVLSVVADSEGLGLPSDAAFKPELDELRGKGLRLSEITNQAVAEEYRKSGVPTELMRCVVAHLAKMGVDKAIATVSPSHNAFYELLGFREIGGERSYSSKLHDPVVALGADIEPFRDPPEGMNDTEEFVNKFLGSENPYREHIKEWEREARHQFTDPELLGQLFVQERNLLSECNERELDVLLERWGHNLFSAVFIPSTMRLLDAVIDPPPADTQTNCAPVTTHEAVA